MTSKNGVGSWVALAILILLLVLAIIFMVVGWTSGNMDTGQQMSGAGYVAMTFGIVATLALGIGLMALMFYSNRKGHD